MKGTGCWVEKLKYKSDSGIWLMKVGVREKLALVWLNLAFGFQGGSPV